MTRSGHRRVARGTGAVALAVLAAWSGPAAAQQVPPPATADPTPPPPLGISPRGALVRAMLVPGWGHAAIGSYTRGGFYFALETITAYSLIRTRVRLSDTRERAAQRETFLRESLALEGVDDPAEISARLSQDARLESYRALISSRESQQEDLVAFGIFVIFLTGADAYVSAHLSRFPTPIAVEASVGDGGRAEVALRVPLPR